jgi:hypothetical protein
MKCSYSVWLSYSRKPREFKKIKDTAGIFQKDCNAFQNIQTP